MSILRNLIPQHLKHHATTTPALSRLIVRPVLTPSEITEQSSGVYAVGQAAYDQGYRDGANSAWADVIAILQDAEDPLAELRRRTNQG